MDQPTHTTARDHASTRARQGGKTTATAEAYARAQAQQAARQPASVDPTPTDH
jgi:hypothetical protein